MLRSRTSPPPTPDYRDGVCTLVFETSLAMEDVLRRLRELNNGTLTISGKKAPLYGGEIWERKFWLGEWRGRQDTDPQIFGHLDAVEHGTRITMTSNVAEVQARGMALATLVGLPLVGLLVFFIVVDFSITMLLLTIACLAILVAVLWERGINFPATFTRQAMNLARWLNARPVTKEPATVAENDTGAESPALVAYFVSDTVRAIHAAHPWSQPRGFRVLKELLYEGERTAEAIRAAVEARDLSRLDRLPSMDAREDIARLVLVEDADPFDRLLLIVDPIELYDNPHVARDFGSVDLRAADLAEARKYIVPAVMRRKKGYRARGR